MDRGDVVRGPGPYGTVRYGTGCKLYLGQQCSTVLNGRRVVRVDGDAEKVFDRVEDGGRVGFPVEEGEERVADDGERVEGGV